MHEIAVIRGISPDPPIPPLFQGRRIFPPAERGCPGAVFPDGAPAGVSLAGAGVPRAAPPDSGPAGCSGCHRPAAVPPGAGRRRPGGSDPRPGRACRPAAGGGPAGYSVPRPGAGCPHSGRSDPPGADCPRPGCRAPPVPCGAVRAGPGGGAPAGAGVPLWGGPFPRPARRSPLPRPWAPCPPCRPQGFPVCRSLRPGRAGRQAGRSGSADIPFNRMSRRAA